MAVFIRLVLVPGYRADAAGLDPSDVQFPLTREMLATGRRH